MITKDDTLFHFCTKEDFVPNTHISYYGWECGVKHKFNNYIKGYREAAECIYQRFVQSQIDNRIDIQDTICYPLIFTYRHCFELSLKFLYLNLFDDIDKETAKDLFKKGHNLNDIWNYIKSDVEKVSNRISFTIDYCAIESYMNQFHKEDILSFNYRYPVDKSVNEIHTTWKYLNIVNFHERMNALLDYLQDINHSIENQLTELEFNEDFNSRFDNILSESKHKIIELFSYYDKKGKQEKQRKDKVWLQMSDIQMPSEEDIENEYIFLNSFTLEQKTLFLIMCHTGQILYENNLAANKEERKKDVYRLLFNHCNPDYDFDVDSDYKNNTFKSKVIDGNQYSKQQISGILKELGVQLQE